MHFSHPKQTFTKKRGVCVSLAITLMLLLGSCSKSSGVYYEQFLEFGTLIDVKIWGVNEDKARQVVALIAKDFAFMHRTWHTWKPSSLGRVNQLLPSEEKFTVGPSLIPLIKRSAVLSRASGYRFNPAIGRLIHLWGFATDTPAEGPPPSDAAIKAIVALAPTMDDIILEGIQIRSVNPAVQLDFGGFAKGIAVDMAIEHLQALGIENAIINAGGDLRAIGRHGERAWRIGIRNPRGEGVLAAVDVQGDESVFTSGDYERFFEYDGVRYHHILDPHTGYPTQGVASVTVFDAKADRADAAATALLIAGVNDWYSVAVSMGVSGVMLITSDGTIHMTPNLKNRVYFENQPSNNIIWSKPLPDAEQAQ
ncbi:MAG: FAD:protein FMN transferase [Gammaproteobacteria bacterium]|nr:FAD:protein FMN transferase [Gammaproteobacteria bacterium]